jgi:hypothetical protein
LSVRTCGTMRRCRTFCSTPGRTSISAWTSESLLQLNRSGIPAGIAPVMLLRPRRPGSRCRCCAVQHALLAYHSFCLVLGACRGAYVTRLAPDAYGKVS